jgi:Dolichyl-phosphate-mannose-protein mannosyltransferase
MRLADRRDSPAADRRAAVALVVLALTVYNLNFRVIQDGDTTPARALPFALWRTGSVRLDPVAGLVTAVPPGKPYHEAYWVWRSPAGHLYSCYPIVTPLLVSPLYAPAVAWLAWRGWEAWRLENTALRMEKIAASLLASLSVGLFYLLARRQADPRRAFLAAVAYGFATGTWVISSQALWLHGAAELLAVCALLAATAEPRPATLAAAGLAAGLMAGNRPPDALLAAGILVYIVARRGRQALWALAAAAAALAPVVAYNLAVFRHLAGGYAVSGLAGPHPFYAHPLLPGVAGLLLSPAKGLLVFSPFLLFLGGRLLPVRNAGAGTGKGAASGGAAWTAGAGAGTAADSTAAAGTDRAGVSVTAGAGAGTEAGSSAAARGSVGAGWTASDEAPARQAPKRHAAGVPGSPDRLLDLSVAGACVAQLLFYASTDYRAGACYGPRFLTDMLPFLVWLLVPVVARLHGFSLRAFVAAVAAGVVIQAIGAFCYPRGRSDDRYYPPELPRLTLAPSVWSFADAPFLVEARAGLAPPELLPHRHGRRP